MARIQLVVLLCLGTVSSGLQDVVLIRHAERRDHVDPAWATVASRPHDGPLSWRGMQQAEELGRHLRGVLGSDVTVYSSPLVRCVQTAHWALKGMGHEVAETPMINVEPCLAETEKAIHTRMTRTHHESLPREAHIPEGNPYPVLLTPGDLLSASPFVNISHAPSSLVDYDAAGREMYKGEFTTARERIARCLEPLLQNAGVQPARPVLIFTHGGIARHSVRHLSTTEPAQVRYAQSFFLKPTDANQCTPQAGSMELVGSWSPVSANDKKQT